MINLNIKIIYKLKLSKFISVSIFIYIYQKNKSNSNILSPIFSKIFIILIKNSSIFNLIISQIIFKINQI